MHIQRVYHPVARLLTVEGEVQIGSGKHDRLRALFIHHPPAGIQEKLSLGW